MVVVLGVLVEEANVSGYQSFLWTCAPVALSVSVAATTNPHRLCSPAQGLGSQKKTGTIASCETEPATPTRDPWVVKDRTLDVAHLRAA